MISVLIITRNEQLDLPGCIESARWSDDIHVFDSFSTDGTVEIARSLGARVTQRKFNGYAAQRNAALQSLPFRHSWVLLLDADERVPDPLANEIRSFTLKAPPEVCAARIRRRDFFQGTWLKHAQISPFYIRLVQPERVHYEREINEVLVPHGRVHDLQEPFDHFPFSKGIRHWIDKHNTYSDMEARLIAEAKSHHTSKVSLIKAIFASDFNERRSHQKQLFYKLPGRPLLKFCYMLLVRRAFLDGRAGLTYVLLQSIYEYMIVLKTRELLAGKAGKHTSSPNVTPPGPVLPTPPSLSKSLWGGVFLLFFVAVCYLSLKPRPSISEVPWCLGFAAHWFDRHDHVKNMIGFGALGFSGLMAAPERLFLLAPSTRLRLLVPALALYIFIGLLEIIQLWLPLRTCDWSDIVCGWSGITIAWAIVAATRPRPDCF